VAARCWRTSREAALGESSKVPKREVKEEMCVTVSRPVVRCWQKMEVRCDSYRYHGPCKSFRRRSLVGQQAKLVWTHLRRKY
jgi:hypothetical protein